MQSRFALDEPRTFVCLPGKRLMPLIIRGDRIFHWKSGQTDACGCVRACPPAALRARPRAGARADAEIAGSGHSSATRGGGRCALGRESLGPRLSQSARHRRGLRQGCARARRRAWHGFRSRGNRYGDAARAGGQSAPARVPADPRPGADQPPGVQQFRARGGAGAAARARPKGVLGINVGANKDAADRAADYVAGVRAFYDVASYFTVNISSPNTPGLRDLQAPAALDELVGRVLQAREEMMAAGRPKRPVVVKLAPDIAEDDIAPIVRVLEARGVDGIAVSNSTLARERLGDAALAKEAGGISGRPLFHRSTVVLARVHVLTGGRIPLIGIGGINSGRDGHRQAGSRRHAAAALYGSRLRGTGIARPHQAGDGCPCGAREACAHRRFDGAPRRGMGSQGARGMMRRPGVTCSGLASSGVR